MESIVLHLARFEAINRGLKTAKNRLSELRNQQLPNSANAKEIKEAEYFFSENLRALAVCIDEIDNLLHGADFSPRSHRAGGYPREFLQ